MKTREELDALSLTLYWHMEHGETRKAIQLLDDLHSDGLKDAVEIVKTTKTQQGDQYGSIMMKSPCAFQLSHAILTAISNKPKL